MNYYVHQVRGRLRIKIPSIKSSFQVGERIQDILEKVNGVGRVSVNQITGSVLVMYDSDLVDPEEILKALQRHGYLDQSGVIPPQDRDSDAFSKTQEVIGKALFGWALGKALENAGLSFLTALI
jgi:copper chaperone CopZ